MAPLEKADPLQGTLDLLILKVVALGPVHGYGISQRIQQISESVLRVQQGSLYPALHRLEKRGWLEADWGESAISKIQIRNSDFKLQSADRFATLTDHREIWSLKLLYTGSGLRSAN